MHAHLVSSSIRKRYSRKKPNYNSPDASLDNQLFAPTLAALARYGSFRRVCMSTIARLGPALIEVRSDASNVTGRTSRWHQAAEIWARAAANTAPDSRYCLPPRAGRAY